MFWACNLFEYLLADWWKTIKLVLKFGIFILSFWGVVAYKKWSEKLQKWTTYACFDFGFGQCGQLVLNSKRYFIDGPDMVKSE